MVKLTQFDEYMAHLCEGLGYTTRHRSLIDYCSGLMLPIARCVFHAIVTGDFTKA